MSGQAQKRARAGLLHQAGLPSLSEGARRLLGPLASLPAPSAVDWAAALALAIAAFVATLIGFDRLGLPIQHISTWDYWFESDPRRIVALAEDRKSYHHHSTSHHPLFSLAMFPPVAALRAVGLSLETALGVALGTVSALWLALTYLTLRLFGLRLVEAASFALLAAASAFAVFWFPVPETFSFGALTIMGVITLCALAERAGGAPFWVYVLAGVLAISMTTTNWLVALAMFWVFLGWRQGALAAICSMVVTLALWAVEHTIFPQADSFLNVFRGSEVDYLFNPESIGVAAKLIAAFFHAIAMPEISVAYGYRLTVQPELPGGGSLVSLAAVLAWSGLLALGVWGALRVLRTNAPEPSRPASLAHKTVQVLLLAIAGQVLISILFGIETFLYTAHIGPLLILLAALSVWTPARAAVWPVVALLAVVVGVHNVARFEQAATSVDDLYETRKAFADLVVAQTDPDALVLCGTNALAGSGEAEMPREGVDAPPREINQLDDPNTCIYSFNGAVESRQGWLLWYEDWSADIISAYAQRGARYFVTSYKYGLENSRAMFDDLDTRYTVVTRTPEWAIYDLQTPAAPAQGAP